MSGWRGPIWLHCTTQQTHSQCICLTSGAPIPLYMLLQSSRESREIIILALLEWWKLLITILSKSNAVWITKLTLICGWMSMTAMSDFLDWILMIALKRQKCFHLQKWESIIAGESLKNWEQISLLLCLVFLIPWFLCGQDVAWYKHFGGKLAAEWVPYLQTHIKSKLSGPSCDPRWFSGASFWTVAHFHPGWWNIKARHFSVCNRVSKILTLRNRTFPLKETFYVLLISLFPLVIIFYNELHICQGVLLC